MTTRPSYRRAACFAALLPLLTLLVGCPEKEPAKDQADDQAKVKAEVVAKLAKADELDGKVDKIVSKCANCRLGMAGSADNTLETHGYAMHFCKAGCKEKFESDPDKAILALEIPKK